MLKSNLGFFFLRKINVTWDELLYVKQEAEGIHLSIDTERVSPYFHVLIPIPEMAWIFFLLMYKKHAKFEQCCIRSHCFVLKHTGIC